MRIEAVPCTIEEVGTLADAGRLYAVLDACDTPAVVAKAEELGTEQSICLYSGTAQEEYWSFAPYLFKVRRPLLEWIRETIWTEPWGIFAVSDSSLEILRRHFKKFLVVESPGGEQWYFRYYDPRVLRTFLPTCDDAQIEEMFGPVEEYLAVSDEAGAVCRLGRPSGGSPPDTPGPGQKPPRLRVSF
jgi:hypothetical protein